MQDAQAVANAYNAILAMLVTELDGRGLMSKSGFTHLLRETRKSALALDPDLDPQRADLVIFKNLTDMLERAGPWRPVVIDGGRQD